MREVYVIDGARTPFGRFGGTLAGWSAAELGTIAAAKAMSKAGVLPQDVDTVVFGNVIQTDTGGPYLARHIALEAGIPVEVPALTVNRLCGSGLQAVVSAAQEIRLGESELALAGGAESMSRTPYVLRQLRFGMRMGHHVAVDLLQEVLTDCREGVSMGVTAENLAKQYGISRADQDAFAALSHHRAAEAQTRGRFAAEIVPVPVRTVGGESWMTADEHIRPNTSAEALAELRPAFLPDGTVTAGNASGINDGAAAVVLASADAVDRKGLRPLARIAGWALAGVHPAYMGIGPVPAVQKLLTRCGLKVQDVDLWEINEAFASQYLSVERALGLPRDRTNVNGGAIALGHPVGASGARLLLTLAYELERRRSTRGVAALCIGGGQGIAVLLERA